jgi:hypothetical protein
MSITSLKQKNHVYFNENKNSYKLIEQEDFDTNLENNPWITYSEIKENRKKIKETANKILRQVPTLSQSDIQEAAIYQIAQKDLISSHKTTIYSCCLGCLFPSCEF